jgi:hypothetical protein
MSLECSECERDLRGVHGEECSRADCVCGHLRRAHYGRLLICRKCICKKFVPKPEDYDA